MAVANQIDFKTLSTCKDFAMAFMSRIGNMVSRYTEVRLIFDRYLEQSLKARTKEAKTAGVQIRYSKIFLFQIALNLKLATSFSSTEKNYIESKL